MTTNDPTPPEAPQGAPAARHTILIVEDSPDNTDVYARYLRRVGYEVLTAYDAERGLALAREHRPDLIVMDVGLPRMDGIEATRALKADPATQAIGVIVVTAHVHPDDEWRAVDAGCDLFRTKPFAPRMLAEDVRRLLGDLAPPSQVP